MNPLFRLLVFEMETINASEKFIAGGTAHPHAEPKALSMAELQHM
jgi:hypothetical protein